MAQGLEVDLKNLVIGNSTFGPAEVRQLQEALAGEVTRYRALREVVQQIEQDNESNPSQATQLRLGLCYYLLGRYSLATTALKQLESDGMAQFYLAKSYAAQEQFENANKHFEAAARHGYDQGACALGRASALRAMGNGKASLKVLDELFGPIEQTAEYLYQRGATVAALGNNPSETIALFERAVEADPHHPGALFGLAMENDRRGNDEQAMELYERSAAWFPPHLGTLLNLGILYEDRNQFDRARQCYQRILDAYPNHSRARLFFKDASASNEMFYDEDAQKRRDRLSQLLSIPVTDFELSVRSRNCLQKMGVMTLGDLTSTTEQELLASKNFGETSLVEIKEMMASKGLSLGQFAADKQRSELTVEPQFLSPDEQVLLNRPISDLSLSVRARKCMVRLGVSTIADLIRHTGDELLECKNFGVTSLNEVREKLTSHGLKLRGD